MRKRNVLEKIFLNKGKFSGNLFMDFKIKIEEYLNYSKTNYLHKENYEIYDLDILEKFPDLEEL